jgi:hypothetical protein
MVQRVRFYRPLQLAPLVVVATEHPLGLSRNMWTIEKPLDPKSPAAKDDRRDWAYEGFYFEARDDTGVPSFAVFNFWRGPGGGGGQWARSEALYPYEHG